MKIILNEYDIACNGQTVRKRVVKEFPYSNADGVCEIREDLRKEKVGVPLTDSEGKTIYYYGNGLREYRWLADTDGFQIKYRNKWYDAESIDWDFNYKCER